MSTKIEPTVDHTEDISVNNPIKTSGPVKVQKRISFSDTIHTEDGAISLGSDDKDDLVEPTEFGEFQLESDEPSDNNVINEPKSSLETYMSELRRILSADLDFSIKSNNRENLTRTEIKRRFSQIYSKRIVLGMTLSSRIESSRKRREAVELDCSREIENLKNGIKSLRETIDRSGLFLFSEIKSENLDEIFKEINLTVNIISCCVNKVSREAELYGATKEEERVSEEFMAILNQIEEIRNKTKQERNNLKDFKEDLYKMIKSSPNPGGLNDIEEKLQATAAARAKYRRSRSLAQLFPPSSKLSLDKSGPDETKISNFNFQLESSNNNNIESQPPIPNYLLEERRGSKQWLEDALRPMVSIARSLIHGPNGSEPGTRSSLLTNHHSLQKSSLSSSHSSSSSLSSEDAFDSLETERQRMLFRFLLPSTLFIFSIILLTIVYLFTRQ